MRIPLLTAAFLALWLAGCQSATDARPAASAPPVTAAMPLRFATFNTSLYDETHGGLIARLDEGDEDARRIAATIQHLRPDVLLLNEFDYDPAGRAATLFQQRYLGVGQLGEQAITYPYRYLAEVNTGVPSGLDLDQDGRIGGEGRFHGNDAWGYGLHPGQYGMLVLSRHPIDADAVRTFRLLRWSTMPRALEPRHPDGRAFYPADVWSKLRLSSKSHWDVPIDTPLGRIHLLAAHPTPPVFDGPERRNAARNHDEIRLWAEYVTPGDKPWLCDDAGRCGGLDADARFVIAGDYNADPADGGSLPGTIHQLLEHARVVRYATPRSDGAAADAATSPGNASHKSSPAHDTASFGPRNGNFRVDYVLPSVGLPVQASGVFWPRPGETGAAWLDATDHRLVWVDLATPE
ncbi:MAG: endonuclease/exonuclease/phosphatase family protein [Arenimonas sp.]|uniref:endonuclease/exonuclease/phosphatase family protein n=1 Tax=Arenimonas sp. TaxID=1872635 RepID=UPI0025BFB023|nr:endonuclease/exonuclease/phosphatase family protein [Arenimonas sp.]MBW8366598.1 endonuclease/exonuclease/phosphatase family protein [Arenimonas sp.]